jgi:starvation-inducible DNA-binding protein
MMQVPATGSKPQSLVFPLRNLFADNFVVYYKSHGYHFNVEGPTFNQDHAFLEEIYSFLIEQHDGLGEQIRQLDKAAPSSLKAILDISEIHECLKIGETMKDMLTELNDDFDTLHRNAQWLFEASDAGSNGGLNTMIGDYIRGLSKLHWKIKATLNRSMK